MAKFYKVKSFTVPDLEYQVVNGVEGWKCDCPGFAFSKRGVICDHIRKVRHQKMKYHGRKKCDKVKPKTKGKEK